MTRIRDGLAKVVMILTLAVLPGGVVQCELDDGELEIDLDGIDIRFDDFDDDDYYVDVFYDDYDWDPYYDCCW